MQKSSSKNLSFNPHSWIFRLSTVSETSRNEKVTIKFPRFYLSSSAALIWLFTEENRGNEFFCGTFLLSIRIYLCFLSILTLLWEKPIGPNVFFVEASQFSQLQKSIHGVLRTIFWVFSGIFWRKILETFLIFIYSFLL